MSKQPLSVTLTHSDLVKIASSLSLKLSHDQGYMEWIILKWILNEKQIDFFEEKSRLMANEYNEWKEEKNRGAKSMGD